jgi:hypothetical protein
MTDAENPRQGLININLPKEFTRQHIKDAFGDDFVNKIQEEFKNNAKSVTVNVKPNGPPHDSQI